MDKTSDPTTGEWHEVRAEECLPSVVETADKYRKKGRRGMIPKDFTAIWKKAGS